MSNKVNYTPRRKRNYRIDSERFFHFLQRKKCIGSKKKLSYGLILILLISLGAPLAFVTANPGVHVQVPQSPLAPNQPVYIEFFTDPGEDGTIQLDITKPPLLAIFWQSGPQPITGGLLYDITAPGFSDPGTYVVSASVNLAGGGPIYGSTTFEVSGGGQPGGGQPGFDYDLEVLPPVTEVEKGETAQYQVSVIYSNPAFSGTVVTVQVEGLGPGMNWHMEPGGQLFITTSPETPPGDYTFDVVGEAQGVVRQTNATIIVREGPEEPPPEEPPPEEHPPEEHPPEEQPPEPPLEEHPPEQPPEEHPPEGYYPEEERTALQEEQPSESAVVALLQNPLFLVVIALILVIVILLIVLRRPKSQPLQPSTRYCSKCGTPLKPGDAFCGSCGERVKD